jgi:hypothetical protein
MPVRDRRVVEHPNPASWRSCRAIPEGVLRGMHFTRDLLEKVAMFKVAMFEVSLNHGVLDSNLGGLTNTNSNGS